MFKPKTSPAIMHDPTRDELAAAIERHSIAVRQLAANEEATSATRRLIPTAEADIEKHKEAVEQAKANAARHLTDSVLGAAGDAPLSIKDARAALQDARDTLEAAQGALEGLVAAHKAADDSVELSRMTLKSQIGAAVSSSPTVSRLLAEYFELQRQLAQRRSVLLVIDCKSAIPHEHRHWASRRTDETDDAGIALWNAAFAALETDADASLPGATR
jgi:hypothetical protein